MIRTSPSQLADHAFVTFELPAALWADRIFVIGDFNHWHPNHTPLRQERDGVWRTTLDLPTGRQYHFCYVVDGERRTEFHADGFAVAAESGHHSILALP
jgi:1,4-alpha-glucan branching enzyme